ncbi:MAG: 50S ribosomal protein L21 [Syntrophaceae bacterium CG2_30_49_12]|nr:MAG: 50S ribosomal protein L21 [Syntrophaceae bacterium CG2_30_49_12]PIP05891.1 MAG: 50S ribosomal protein L21 [Syntrophobacterales bacterium CG23_combo_of_CG06-09_8_20_14_all_48_27]PJA49459.1 MAG: 50S ribosomal protein L21 [Syntrophobacterales bacterium CG_4_9_14_3_um_filter_49_8]PJC73323.1 MAG: 50S ribosomal protein L21 [Syntrophobacterales bacterium CG_4_8_14_3_um_filter_49_14]
MYAIIKTGGKQHKVSPGDVVAIEKINGNKGESVVFDDVLMVADNGNIKVGTPLVEGARVVAEVLAQAKAAKIFVFRMKRRKGYHKKTGHRQKITNIKIKEISF